MIVLFSIVLVFVAVAGYLVFCPNGPINKSSAIETTIAWARLAPFPKSVSMLNIETQGSALTREFTITFEAPVYDIETWLDKSPGTKKITPVLQKDGSYKYTITPGEGASFAELFFFEKNGKVLIHTYRS